MGMSTHVVGFRPADEKWKRMKAVWDACAAADTKIPDEVSEFFEGEPPGDKPGAEVDISQAVTEWNDDCRSGHEIEISKLPPDVRIIRAFNSW